MTWTSEVGVGGGWGHPSGNHSLLMGFHHGCGLTWSSGMGGGGGCICLETLLFSHAFILDIVDDLEFRDGGGGGGIHLEIVLF